MSIQAKALAAELAEKKRQRAERFGTVSEEDKAAARAKRFAGSATGAATGDPAATANDLEAKRKVRAYAKWSLLQRGPSADIGLRYLRAGCILFMYACNSYQRQETVCMSAALQT